MKIILLVCALLTISSNVSAQLTQPCSQISIEAVQKVDPSPLVMFTTRVADNLSREDLNYRWQVSPGTITMGQTSSQIQVDTTGLAGQVLNATLEVRGREWTCSVKSTVHLALPPIICGLAFDQYGDIRFEDEEARLDNFAIQLMNQPESRGAIIVHAGNPSYKGEAADRLRRSKNYLVNVRGIDSSRLLQIDAGYASDVTTHLYIVPKGATTPLLESTIPLAQIKFTNARPTTKIPRSARQPRR